MKKYLYKIISICLIFVCILNMCSIFVYADSNQNRENFINFYASSDGALLNAKNMTAQDYYTLGVFASNFFEPGLTTLKDISEASYTDECTYFKNMIDVLGKKNDSSFQNQLADVMNAISGDIISLIQSGKGTLYSYAEGHVKILLTGKSILADMSKTDDILNIDGIEPEGIWGSAYYYNDNSEKTAIRIDSPAYRAAFTTLACYNPSLFMSSNGLQAMTFLFLDQMGNIWGAKADLNGRTSEEVAAQGLSGMVDSIGKENIYLIMPGCLNPATFSANVSNISQLKMPLMNRFVLSCLLSNSDFNIGTESISNKYIPLFNMLSDTAGFYSKVSNEMLTIFGVNTLTSNLFNFSDKKDGKNLVNKDSKTDKGIALGYLAYNPNLITFSTNQKNGIAKYGSNSYMVFSPNIQRIVKHLASSTQVTNSTDGYHNTVIDIKTNTGGYEFSVYSDISDATTRLKKQQGLIYYLYSPIALDLNNVSMNFYLASASNAESEEDAFASMSNDIYSEESVAATCGMKGFSLFYSMEGDPFTLDDSTDYLCVVPDNTVFSKLSEDMTLGLSIMNQSYYDEFKVGNFSQLSIDNSSCYAFYDDYYKEAVSDKNKWVIDSEIITLTESSDSNYSTHPFHIKMRIKNAVSMGSEGDGTTNRTYDRMISFQDGMLYTSLPSSDIDNDNTKHANKIKDGGFYLTNDSISTFVLSEYAYSIFTPSDSVINATSGKTGNFSSSGKLLGSDEDFKVGYSLTNFGGNTAFIMGMYFGYIVDMCSFESTSSGLSFKSYNPKFLPHHEISAGGGNLSVSADEMSGEESGGIYSSEDTSFEQKQKDLINRIYGLTNDSNNDYRNNLIKNILDGFFLTIHRTITGTWGTSISSVTTGSSSTYQSVTGYIYTPTLEELSFTATLMNNYIKVYIFCMILILFLLVLMVILNMRSWQQGVLIGLVMFVAVLFPYILISNAISIGNGISDAIYSDRFDFWAMTEQQSSHKSLSGLTTMTEKEQILTVSSATSNLSNSTATGVKIKWMSPKKVDAFQSLYSDSSLSESFITNVEIFKWLFNSFIYDSEFVEADTYGTYVYRPYTAIANEAECYYAWGTVLTNKLKSEGTENMTYDSQSFSNIYSSLKESIEDLEEIDESKDYSATLARINKAYYTSGYGMLDFTGRFDDIEAVKFNNESGNKENTNMISLWGDLSSDVSTRIASNIENFNDTYDDVSVGVVSNLPQTTMTNSFDDGDSIEAISRALFLKNTESPYYYFYSVLKSQYDSNISSFKKSLLNTNIYKISPDENALLTTGRNATNAIRDFLDLEGLFTDIIPYLNDANKYVSDWQAVNGTEIEQYNFEYEVDDTGNATVTATNTGSGASSASDYARAVKKKNAMNKVWNMYSPWVDSLYDGDVFNERVTVGGSKVLILDSLNPTSYMQVGRPMIFSEADMIIKGYNYSILTDVEKRIQAVLENTYKDLLYLVNYYDLDDNTLISAAAMYATFNFNAEFSTNKFFGNSVTLYPQGFELRNFNYDAFMRLALLNATGENIFDDTDLYERVLSKTSIFTGLALIICDLIACVVIPALKFVIIVSLLFLGLLLCITLVVNPPEKIFNSIMKSTVLPTFLFMTLNVIFAWVMSLIIGEGLTAYVGSKTVNFATNDPTMTMILMAALGIGYVVFAVKILKMIIAAYKEFGLSTVLSTVGIVGSAFKKGTSKIGSFVAGATGGLIGAGAGIAVAKATGHSALEGAATGGKGMMRAYWNDKRMQKNFSQGAPGSRDVTEKINTLSGAEGKGSGNPNVPKSPVKPDVKPNVNKSVTSIPNGKEEKYTTANDVKGKVNPNMPIDKNATGVAKAGAAVIYSKEYLRNKLSEAKTIPSKVQNSLRNTSLSIKEKALDTRVKLDSAVDKASKTVKEAPQRIKNYTNKTVQDLKYERDFAGLMREERENERLAKQMGDGRKTAERARAFEERRTSYKASRMNKKTSENA